MTEKKNSVEEDLALAREIAAGLEVGDTSGLEKIVHFQLIFLKYAQRELFKEADPEDAVQQFWLVKIIKGNTIANYRGEKGASLETYLKTALQHHIVDVNRKVGRDRKAVTWDPSLLDDLNSGAISAGPHESAADTEESSPEMARNRNPGEGSDVSGAKDTTTAAAEPLLHPLAVGLQSTPPTWEELHDRELWKVLLEQALRELGTLFPRDEKVMRGRMEGVAFNEIARSLSHPNAGAVDIKRLENTIKKQFERRDGPNTVHRFKIILERILVERRLAGSFIDAGMVFTDPEIRPQVRELYAQLKNEALEALSLQDPAAAIAARHLLCHATLAEFALLFGRKEGQPIQPRDDLKKLDRCVQNVLQARGLELTIHLGQPCLKKSPESVTSSRPKSTRKTKRS